MAFPELFPEEIWREIREYPGNQKCCDCSSLDTDWGSISHGTLICLECAGKHRSLGVQVSFVRSLKMDSWSVQQVEMMKQGGNDQIRRFFKKLEIENSPIQTLYCTKGANHYRERLKERVDKIMRGEIKSDKRIIPGQQRSQSMVVIQRNSQDDCNNNIGTEDMTLNIVFKDGPMGMTLTKDYRDMAIVSRLMPGGPAMTSGVRVGDYIAGVSGKALINYDEIMHMIPCMSRPLTIRFNRRGLHHTQSQSLPYGQQLAMSGVSRSISSGTTMSASHGSLHMHPSRSESTLTASAAGEVFTESHRYQETGVSSGDNSRSTSKDYSCASSGNSRSNSTDVHNNIMRSFAVDNSHNQKVSPRTLVRIRSARVMQKNGSASDGDDVAITSAKLSPRSSKRDVFDCSESDLSPEVSPVQQRGGGSMTTDKALSHTETDANVIDDNIIQSHELAEKLNRKLVFTAAASSHQNAQQDTESGGEEGDDEEEEGRDVKSAANKKAILESGTIIKVKQSDNNYRNAVIMRRHKDGSCKVLYKDESTESHVPLSRLAISQNVLNGLNSNKIDTQKSVSSVSSSSPVVNDNIKIETIKPQQSVENKHDIEVNVNSSISSTVVVNGSTSSDCNDSTETGFSSNEHINSTENALSSAGIIRIIFQAPPLGLTLSAQDTRSDVPVISKLVDGGQAMLFGLRLGDILVSINKQHVNVYQDTMRILLASTYPLELTFKRTDNCTNGSSVVNIRDNLNGVADTKPNTLIASVVDISISRGKQQEASSNHQPISVGISRHLSRTVSNNEVDITFNENDFGLVFEEKVGIEVVSVVTEVHENGAAHQQGVKVGYILRGINYERCISHVHSMATLKYIKRPVVLRFHIQ